MTNNIYILVLFVVVVHVEAAAAATLEVVYEKGIMPWIVSIPSLFNNGLRKVLKDSTCF